MPAPIAGGDPAAGKLVFRKCQVCHSLEPGKDVLGPSLAGIIGRKSGAESIYAYSPAMKDANLTWDARFWPLLPDRLPHQRPLLPRNRSAPKPNKMLPHPSPPMSPTLDTRCDQASLKVAWSMSVSAVRSTVR